MTDMWFDVDTALAEVPVNIMPLIDDADFKSREVSIAYNAAGMDLVWNFVTTGGAFTQTAVTPTTAGVYDWAHQGDGMYSLEIPASGGGSINNDTEGFGWFTGLVTGVLPWRGPIIGFRAAALNNALIDGGDNLDVNAVQWLGQAVTLSGNNKPDVNVDEVRDSVTTAQNLKSDYDGSGYTKTNSTIGTTTANTDMRGTDNAALASVASEVRLAELDAGNIPTDLTNINSAIGVVDGIVAAILIDTDTTIPALIAALNDLSAGEVNAEVLDVMVTDTFSEPVSVPAATASLKDMLHWLFSLSRNKGTQTATTKTLRNDADSGDIATSAIADAAGTFTRDEYT